MHTAFVPGRPRIWVVASAPGPNVPVAKLPQHWSQVNITVRDPLLTGAIKVENNENMLHQWSEPHEASLGEYPFFELLKEWKWDARKLEVRDAMVRLTRSGIGNNWERLFMIFPSDDPFQPPGTSEVVYLFAEGENPRTSNVAFVGAVSGRTQFYQYGRPTDVSSET